MISADTCPDHCREHWLISNSRAYRYRWGRPAEPSALAPIDGTHCVVVRAISALGIEDKTGSLEVGKRLDAIIVDVSDFPDYITEDENAEQLFERWVRTGSKSQICNVYVDGHVRVDNT